MEKIFLKPTVKEILLKGSNKEGAIDLFSYDYDHDKARRALGNLYVVGNVSGGGAAADGDDELDVAYVINLVASLAKREYYSDPEVLAKDAFASALKKINGVVEEFFKKKDTKINIGIFAIANGEIHISKLGKFKIILSRDEQNIDILNNLTLFNKEVTQEKEFSSIISGKIHEGDRILAFYPSRTVTARERYLKEYLLKNDQEGFAAKLAAIKEDKEDFACAALHINIDKGHEAAIEPRIQPKELREETITPRAQLAAEEEDADEEKISEEKPTEHPQVKTTHYARPEEIAQVPHIIPSEFALGKRALPFSKHLHRAKNLNLNPKSKLVAGIGALVILVAAFMTLKSFFFVSSSAKALNTAASQAESNLKDAQAKISQNDLAGAHVLLASTLSSIIDAESQNGSSSKADAAKDDVMKALDNLDGAVSASLNSVASIPDSSGTATMLTAAGSDLYAYLKSDNGASLVKISSGSLDGTYALSDIEPNQLYGDDAHVVAFDLSQKKVASLATSNDKITSSTVASPDSFGGASMFSDNIYAIDGSGVMKVTDAALGQTSASPWLKSGESLPSDSTLITVDGNVYILSSSGTLTTYYLGKKASSVSTPLAADSSELFLTTQNGANLYLVNTQLGRIYVLDKKAGTLVKTYKVNAQSAIQGAAVTDDGTIYILSGNKIWEVQ